MPCDPTTNLCDAVTCIAEAARLHLSLGEQSTEKYVVAALEWRFRISEYAARECHSAALKLLDAMPRKR